MRPLNLYDVAIAALVLVGLVAWALGVDAASP
jgi:hypothetical protein